PLAGLVTGRSPFDLFHRHSSEALSVCRLRVAHDLLKAGVSGDRRDFVRCASSLSQPHRGGLTQPVKGTVRQVCHVALFAEPVSEPCRSKWLAKFSDQKSQMLVACCVDDSSQIRMNRNG